MMISDERYKELLKTEDNYKKLLKQHKDLIEKYTKEVIGSDVIDEEEFYEDELSSV